MKKLRLILVLLVGVMSSCTITQEFHFNNDYSGEVKNIFDVSMLKGFVASMDTTNTNTSSMDSMDVYLEETKLGLNDVKGISNVKLSWADSVKTKLVLSYKFEGLEPLNKALSTCNFPNAQEKDKNGKFRKKWGKLYYQIPQMPKDSMFQEASVQQMLNYNLIFSFEKEVKKVSTKHAELTNQNKQVEIKGTMTDYLAKKFDKEISIKLK